MPAHSSPRPAEVWIVIASHWLNPSVRPEQVLPEIGGSAGTICERHPRQSCPRHNAGPIDRLTDGLLGEPRRGAARAADRASIGAEPVPVRLIGDIESIQLRLQFARGEIIVSRTDLARRSAGRYCC